MAHFFHLNCKKLLIALICPLGLLPLKMQAAEQPIGDGIWFTCEFTQSKTPPTDGCEMFDDEGFQLADGRLSYLRITHSDETACRGNKKGQCFRRDRPNITITKTDRGRLTLRKNQFDVKFLGCTQTFYFADTANYREMWPDDDRCFWASKRRFYIAPFDGTYNIAD